MWLVCQDMEGQLFVQSKIEREHELLFCVLCDWGIYTPSYVVKSFATEQQAENYVLEMFEIDLLINKTIQ